MDWWRLVVLFLSLYLLLTLGPWAALQIVEWLLRRFRGELADDEPRLQELRGGEQAHRQRWPETPRPGRYAEPDRTAQENLGVVSQALAEADHLLPTLASHKLPRIDLVGALTWRAWAPLISGLHLLQETRGLQACLEQGEGALVRLEELARFVHDLPGRVRSLLNEQRAEVVRLSALYETEVERGTKGLDDVEREIASSQAQIETALDELSQATEDVLPGAAAQADILLEALTGRLAGLEERLEQAALERTQAHDALARIEEALHTAEDRWSVLQARGAAEPSLTRALGSLRADRERLSTVARQQTIDAYRETHQRIGDLEGTLQALAIDLDHLEDLMGRSKEAMEGNLKALADSHALCDALVRQDVLLDPDRSLAFVERATQAYTEAERSRGLGTIQGYEHALELAAQGARVIEDARRQVETFPEQVRQVRDLLVTMQPQALGAARSRADRLRERLQVYARHWERGANTDMAEAISLLDQVEVDLERLAPNVRYQRRFRQSETEEALDILSHADASLRRSGELMDRLDAELERIAGLREQFEAGLLALTGQAMPELQALSKGMMPNTKQHLASLALQVGDQARAAREPSRIDYDEAVGTLLPALAAEADQVRLEHERNSKECDELIRDAARRLDRSWSRLARLQPDELPGPEEDIERLSTDVNAWHAEVERQAGVLPALFDLAGRRVALEQRMENAEEQIIEGRRRLESLEKDYRRHAQAARDMRMTVRDREQSSRWTNLHWDWAKAEAAWQDTTRLERAAQQATKLADAGKTMRQAAEAALEAENQFDRVERQMAGVLRRLDDELRAVDKGLERAARQAATARGQGDQEALVTLDALQADAERLVQAAVSSSTVDEALRCLRDARKAIESA